MSAWWLLAPTLFVLCAGGWLVWLLHPWWCNHVDWTEVRSLHKARNPSQYPRG